MASLTAQPSHFEISKADYLIEVIQRLSNSRSLDEITMIVRHAARELVNADGATFVLRAEGDVCHYYDEEAIAPLWKGKKFPMQACISGWAMFHKQSVAIDDIYADDRVPHSAYRPTFVKSLVMTPIRTQDPIGAIGTYWASTHVATPEELKLLKSLANSTSIAIENVRIVADLKKSNDALQTSVHTRDEFLSVAAHELRTPLSALKLQLQLTESDVKSRLAASPVTPDLLDDLALGLRQVTSLSQLIEQLLDISRIRLDRFDLHRAPFKLDDAVRGVVDRMSPALRDSGCKVNVHYLENGQVGNWDRARIEQVITNLLSNACKYAAGAPIEIRIENTKEEAILYVRDHGPGISPQDQEKIFDRFVRATTADHISGLGLGLYIVRSIARSHGGDIKVDSPQGGGVEFMLHLPFASFGESV